MTRPITPSDPTAYRTVGNVLTKITRPLPQRLLGVWAHPDDEAYLSAGLMGRVVDAGGQVAVITATRGEKGTDSPADFDTDAFGARREVELRSSLATLGVRDVRFLGEVDLGLHGLRDGECDVADGAAVVNAIVDVIDEVQPTAIVTFGPDGMTNHPDHRAVSRWTTEAWRRRDGRELLYAAVTHDFDRRHRKTHDQIGAFTDCPDGRPVSVGRERIALECSLDDPELDRKRAALAAHASQTTALAALMGEDVYRTWWRNERFRLPTRAELDRGPQSGWMTETALAGSFA